LLQSLAGQAAIVIQNAQLFESVRAGRERLQSLSHRLVEVQEVERRYIARELHDEIGQLLTGLKLALEVSTRLPADAVKAHLGEARALVNELMAKVQELCLNLRPAMLDDLGLLAALLCHFERYTAQTSVQVTFQHTGLEERRFASEVETAAYRIVQEALTNVARHAGISEATVRLWTDQDAIGVQIEDQGAGFDPEAALAAGACNGLAGMRERATLLGGKLTVESVPGAGTRLTAELPLQGRLERRHYERDDYARG
jgi:signal transduction histidine kinase